MGKVNWVGWNLFWLAYHLVQGFLSVHNNAAQSFVHIPRSERITPALQQLHRFPIRQNINYTIILIAYKSLHSQVYIANLQQIYSTTQFRILYTRPHVSSVFPDSAWNNMAREPPRWLHKECGTYCQLISGNQRPTVILSVVGVRKGIWSVTAVKTLLQNPSRIIMASHKHGRGTAI